MKKSLDDLYSELSLTPTASNPKCTGCGILSQNKAVHGKDDYTHLEESEFLVITQSLDNKFGRISPYMDVEKEVLDAAIPGPYAVASAVKCPKVSEDDMSSDDIKICRQHVLDTIDHVKPRLVLACGNLAMRMILNIRGIASKRGKAFDCTTPNGHKCTVVPVYHPYSVAREPRFQKIFQSDISNAYNIYVLNKKGYSDFEYSVAMDFEAIREFKSRNEPTENWALDVETTGLNFRTDRLQTLSISTGKETMVVPFLHKDSPFNDTIPELVELLNELFAGDNRKVFHNVKFDLKFLMKYGIKVNRPWCTKMMHHLLDENLPKGLMDLVKLYFSDELDRLI